MTSFVDDYGQILEYSGADLQITKQAASFFNFQIKGDFTYNFVIPNNVKNRDVLNYYGARQIASGAFSKNAFTVIKDGAKIMKGYVVIQSSDEIQINCFFVSGNANWFQLMQFSLKDITFPDSLTVAAGAVDSLKTATSGITFPLIDWAYGGHKRAEDFVQTGQLVESQELFPCLYLHTLVENIAAESGVKINGTVTTDPLYQKMIITPSGPDIRWPDWIIKRERAIIGRSATIAMTTTLQDLPMNSITEIGPFGEYSTTAYTWKAKRSGLCRVDLNLKTSVSQQYTVYRNVNGSDVNPSSTAVSSSVVMSLFYNMVAGDTIKIRISAVSSGYNLLSTSQITFQMDEQAWGCSRYLTQAVDPLQSSVSPNAIVPEIKAIEVIKFLSIYFGAVCVYNDYSKTLTLNKIPAVKKETAKDWSKYYISHVEKWDNGSCTNNHIQPAEVSEAIVGDPTYGGGNIETDFTIKEVQDIYTAPFGPSVDNPNMTKMGWMLPFVKFFDLTLGDALGTYSSVSSAGSGLASFGSLVFTLNKIYYVVSDSGEYTGYGIARTSSTLFGIDYTATDTGTVYEVNVSPVDSCSRILIANPGKSVTDAGGPSAFGAWKYDVYPSGGTVIETSSSTGCLAWFDKPLINQAIDINKESLAIDNIPNREYNNTLSEKYLRTFKNFLNGPLIQATMLIPTAVFQSHDFSSYIYLKTETLTGYFLVQKIEAYKDSQTPVMVELLQDNG